MWALHVPLLGWRGGKCGRRGPGATFLSWRASCRGFAAPVSCRCRCHLYSSPTLQHLLPRRRCFRGAWRPVGASSGPAGAAGQQSLSPRGRVLESAQVQHHSRWCCAVSPGDLDASPGGSLFLAPCPSDGWWLLIRLPSLRSSGLCLLLTGWCPVTVRTSLYCTFSIRMTVALSAEGTLPDTGPRGSD